MTKNGKNKIGTCRCNKQWIDNILQLKKTVVLDEINLWLTVNKDNPKGSRLTEGTLFLFRFKPDQNSNKEYIVGGGLFCQAKKGMTYSEAWKYYREANGVTVEKDFYEMAKDENDDKRITSYIIRSPFFLDEDEWIDYYKVISKEVPENTPQQPLAHFEFNEPTTGRIWESIKEKFATIDAYKDIYENMEELEDISKAYQNTRPGQGTFREEILKLFEDTCAVTGINATEVIEAAHIKPYSKVLKHDTSNGIALRADLHRLLDSGYATIRKNGEKFQFVISDKFWKDFNSCSNREEYERWHGQDIKNPRGWNLKTETLVWHHREHKELLGDISKLIEN